MLPKFLNVVVEKRDLRRFRLCRDVKTIGLHRAGARTRPLMVLSDCRADGLNLCTCLSLLLNSLKWMGSLVVMGHILTTLFCRVYRFLALIIAMCLQFSPVNRRFRVPKPILRPSRSCR